MAGTIHFYEDRVLHRNGSNVAVSASVDGTTLRLVAPAGYYDGVDDTVGVTDADFVAGNIKNGITIFGITGTLQEGEGSSPTPLTGEQAATAVTRDGTKLQFTAPVGYYDGTIQVAASDASLLSSNIKSGVTIFGVEGTVVDGSPAHATEQTATTVTRSGTKLQFTAPVGYYSGSIKVTATDANFVASNIKSGVSVFGLTGSLVTEGGGTTPATLFDMLVDNIILS